MRGWRRCIRAWPRRWRGWREECVRGFSPVPRIALRSIRGYDFGRPPGCNGMKPLYVEAAALLSGHLTGIGRFVARLIEALVARTPVRLTTMISREQAAELKLSPRLPCGWDIPLSADDLPARGADIRDWVR